MNEQLDRQSNRISELERLISNKNELLRKTEAALERERNSSTAAASANASPPQSEPNVLMLQSEVAQLKNRCASLDKENVELRRLLGGDRTPKYLPLSPHAAAPHHQTTPSPMSSTPDAETPEENNRTPKTSFKKIFGKIKRSNSGGHLANENGTTTTTTSSKNHSGSNSTSPKKSIEDQNVLPQPAFRRGGLRATAGGRLGWSSSATTTNTSNQVLSRKPFSDWSIEVLSVWTDSLGLGMYNSDIKSMKISSGDQLAKMSSNDLEFRLGMKNPMHRKKLSLAMKARQDSHPEAAQGGLDHHWVIRWLDDIGLPQYKDVFFEARVDGRVLNVLTVEDLLCHLKITNLLHHLSIRRGIQCLRQNNFAPDALKRRAIAGDNDSHSNVSLWSNHRVMEWLREVDLSEYAPNLRGSGVHGSLLIYEPRFTADLLATLLSIPSNKTLLRRHLNIHFKELVGENTISAKRLAQQDPNYVPLTPTAKAKTKSSGQFTLKRKKSKSQFDYDDLLCPFEGGKASSK